MSGKNVIKEALNAVKKSPRVSLGNLVPFPGSKSRQSSYVPKGPNRFGKSRGDREVYGNFPPIGYEEGRTPIYITTPKYPYWKNEEDRREYFPVSLFTIQNMIDMRRIDPTKPIDLGKLSIAKIMKEKAMDYVSGVQLTAEGLEALSVPIHIEAQYIESEKVIVAIERLGGVVYSSYLDPNSMKCLVDPNSFFKKSQPIPPRLSPPKDLIRYYASPENRGYLCDQEEIDEARISLAKREGYTYCCRLPSNLARLHKTTRQVFYFLNPGWIVSLKDRTVIKPRSGSSVTELYEKPLT